MHATGSRIRPRGFTLVELLVSIAVSSIILIALAGVVITQTRAYEMNARTREAAESGRTALSFIETKLRMAGYGIHPLHAFDFSVQRDFATAPDELFIRYRDPTFSRRGTIVLSGSTPTNALTLAQPLKTPIEAGQILMLLCQQATASAYVTVAAAAAAGATSLSLNSYAGTTFPNQTPQDCLLSQGSSSPWVLKVDTFRFFLGPADASGSRTLMMARNAAVAVPVAVGVEDLQIAYVMAAPTPGMTIVDAAPAPNPPTFTDYVLGDAAGVQEQPDPAAVASRMSDGYRAASRFTRHPTNIREVRVSLVTRSDRELTSGSVRPALENRLAGTTADGYFRNVVTTTLTTANMMSRSLFAPSFLAGGS